MTSGHTLDLPRRLFAGRPQAVLLLVGGQLFRIGHAFYRLQVESRLWERGHLNKIEQIPVKDEFPGAATKARLLADTLLVAQETCKSISKEEIFHR